MRILSSAAVAVLVMLSAHAAAECSCLCVDGSLRPVCTAAAEVASNRGLCIAEASRGCPAVAQATQPETYAAPVDGVENCRQAQIYDAGEDDYLTARVCDVAPQE